MLKACAEGFWVDVEMVKGSDILLVVCLFGFRIVVFG
jgi:hypothetical protein